VKAIPKMTIWSGASTLSFQSQRNDGPKIV
jgi:hypothetical protein